ncbi:YtxH domain-containing protein [Alloprevotella rava]|uniref:Gas vesicle protein n=1 Tax=Alloprevotella rava TaxID=671218 RepID=A0A7W5UF98_9BACT|nr:YtxH domain-containing protein [Alloprevotella rava]MBB3703109.1 gas vesicle protein [Alloprevotella rava]
MKGLSIFVSFLGGAAVGAAVGLLLAPEKGADTRKKLLDQGTKIADRVNETLKRKGIKLSREDMEGMVDDIAEELKPVNE